jgi:hypothetical protein
MKFIPLLFVCFLSILSTFSQEKNSKQKQSFSLSGYVKNDFFWDSRQTVSAREGSFLLWPSKINYDANGKDINAVSNFNFLSLQSRLSFSWKGTETLNAKISAKIEGDFFAQNNSNINLFRLRHAFIKMDWEQTNLLIGQYWIPMFTTECFPGTVSFNTGTPFNPFGRNPQIRLSHSLGSIKLSAIANTQRDYSNRGPNGTSGEYLRNSMIPEFTGTINYKDNILSSGVGFGYKQIIPQLITDLGFATQEKLSSYSAFAFIKVTSKPITLKIKGVYGQNTPDYLSISGFAVTDYNTTNGYQKYEPISNLSFWTDIHSNGKKLQVGVFSGYSKNLGTKSAIVGDIYGLGVMDIASLLRVSPRLVYNTGKIRFATDLEYTLAYYGSNFDSKHVAITTEKTGNFRILFAAYYFFKSDL